MAHGTHDLLSSLSVQGERKSKASDSSTPLVVILLITIILLLVAIFLFHRWWKKRSSTPADPPRMSREEMEDQDIRDDSHVTDHTELMRADSQLNDQSPDLNQQVGCAEPSVENADRKDSSVKVRNLLTK